MVSNASCKYAERMFCNYMISLGNKDPAYDDLLAQGITSNLDGGVDQADALALMQTTAELNGSPTIHTVIMDTATNVLRIYIADESSGTEAPYTTPHIIDLNEVFASF